MTPERHVSAALEALSRAQPAGTSLLVSGATARARREFLDALVAELRADASRRLVVRPGPHRDGLRLTEELPAAVEETLAAARAPGGLLDAGNEALARSLGAWLFRARAIGCEGVVIVLDDVDGWINARGAAQELAPLLPLLDATRRRPVSVVATARPGTASGAPGVASELAERFEHVLSLGGTRTVTRDPSALLSLLAGRSFAPSSLRETFTAWLDLPSPAPGHDPDDTLVVFTAPLAPPLVQDGTPDALDWSGSAAAFEAPPEPFEAPVARPSRAPVAMEDVARWSSALRAAVELGVAVRRAESTPVTDARSAGRVFCEAVASIPLAQERLAAASISLGASAPRLLREGRATLARFHETFARVREAPGEAPGEGPLGLGQLLERLTTWAEEHGARDAACVLLTGLRWDLRGHLRDRVLAKISGLQEVESGALWSTPEELSRVTDTPGYLEKAHRPRRKHLGPHEAFRISVYARELTRPKRTLESSVKAVEDSLPAALRSVLGGFAGRTAVLFASDVGVAEPAGSVDEEVEARALGGDSPFAVVLPWSLYTWATRTP